LKRKSTTAVSASHQITSVHICTEQFVTSPAQQQSVVEHFKPETKNACLRTTTNIIQHRYDVCFIKSYLFSTPMGVSLFILHLTFYCILFLIFSDREHQYAAAIQCFGVLAIIVYPIAISCHCALFVNSKKPAHTIVQKPTPAMFS